uniref:Vacuolar protein sorting-associated protein 8 central domain-containing protein n=1 Tax=Theileria annulata TaxID=5874 RepID=A0A3B0MG35_THEAN
MNLEEFLEFLEESDDDVDTNPNNQNKESNNNEHLSKEIDYNEIYNKLVHEELSNDSDSLDLNDSSTSNNQLIKDKVTNRSEEPSGLLTDESFSSDFISPSPIDNSINSSEGKATSKFEDNYDLTESVNIAKESKLEPTAKLNQDDENTCQCKIDNQLVNYSTKNCGELFNAVEHCVQMQLSEWDNKHKLYLINKLREYRNKFKTNYEESHKFNNTDDSSPLEKLIPDISKDYLKALSLPSNTIIEDLHNNRLSIRCRHKLTKPLELLKIFEDRFYSIDDSSINRPTKSSGKILTPTCMCTSSDLIVFGTMCGSVFISEFSLYNSERKFCSYNEYDGLDSSIDPLNWYEIDSEKGVSVTSLDILPNTSWITVGYSDGTVKLLQNFKVTRPPKGHSSMKAEAGDSKNADSRTFGLMADAVSSAFGGIKKTSSQTLCSTDVFNDSVLNCKFTFAESYEEIICSNLKSIAILTYSKNVLSHNLNVNYLQSLNERLENDQVVDIVCLSSNPQAKFITGGDVGGICAILTLKTCLVFSTRPRLSIIINISLDKLNRNVTTDFNQTPSVTWMIFNTGKKNIKPLLLISMGNQIRFIQCNLQTVKGVPSMNVSNMGTIQFRNPIRCIRIVTRLMLAIVDSTNTLHIVQINLNTPQMYYDIIRSLDLSELSNKMELGIDVFDPLWLLQPSILSTITVFSKTVKMVAKGYKKFSNLVSDLFQGKKHTSSFELKNFSILILVPNGALGIEINSWIKVIGELSASKMFCEALSIIYALSEEWIPGLFDFRAFKNNLSQLILYILHQSSAHIIKLSKLVKETQNISTNLLNLDSEAPKEDYWNTKVKTDVYDQINTLCCSMIDICVSSRLYEPLNDLIFRCFATIDLEHVFVKYILLNVHNNRIGLEFLNSQIIESICQTYENVLDSMYGHFLEDHYYLEDEILYLNQVINPNYTINLKSKKYKNHENCDTGKLEVCNSIQNLVENINDDDLGHFLKFKFDNRLLSYHIICNNLCKIQFYCFKNNIITETNKGINRLSRHFSWHCLIYCQSVVLDDYSNILDIIITHAYNKCNELKTQINNFSETKNELVEKIEITETDVDDSANCEEGSVELESDVKSFKNEENKLSSNILKSEVTLPLKVSENLFVVQVFFLTLESFLTFENCGLTETIDTSSYCNIISYLTSTESFKPTFPIESRPIYASNTLMYDPVTIEFDKIESQKFEHDFKEAETSVIFKLLTISPRLFFICLENLFNSTDKFDHYFTEIGTKIATFNFILNVVVSCVYKLEELFGSGSTDMILKMLSFLFLTVSSNTESFYLNLNTTILSIYKLLKLKNEFLDYNPELKGEVDYSKDLIDHDGYFNITYFQDVFYRSNPVYDQECLMIVTPLSVEKAVFTFLRNFIYSISSKLSSAFDLWHNLEFTQVVRMCREFISLTSFSLRFFFYQITGDFNGIIKEYDSLNREENIFAFLDKCIEHIRSSPQDFPENVEHLLLLDSTIRKNFVGAVMKNLTILIKLDLNKVTNLLIQIFSLMDIIKTLDTTLETSPETILNTLEKLPDLQLLVLDALLKSKSTSRNMLQFPNSYFNRYLNLLSIHDKTNVSNFLKRQKSLNITYCLKICKQNNIDDAVIYLLLRAGNLEAAVRLLVQSFSTNIGKDLTVCSTLIKTAQSICQEYENQLSYEIIERMWFTMLKSLIQFLKSDALNGVESKQELEEYGVATDRFGKEPNDLSKVDELKRLVEEIFSVGVLKYVKFPNALREITKYDTTLQIFKKPLHNLLSDFQLQTYIANSASTMSKTIMNKEFRSTQVFNSKGVFINTIGRGAKINRNLVCHVCNKNLIFNLSHEPEIMYKHDKHRGQKPFFYEDFKISNLEEQIGLISQVPIQGIKTNVPGSTENTSNNKVYNDRLSTLISKKTKGSKSFSSSNTFGQYPSLIQSISRDLSYFRKDPIIVFWCNHSFHERCAPISCPICNIDE